MFGERSSIKNQSKLPFCFGINGIVEKEFVDAFSTHQNTGFLPTSPQDVAW